ncbi:hypothetical protein ACIQW9_07050 [Herminiimonas sp. NPDC097707]|uniref:hypothetical protein n=1 Tax=Herminiimonas sp. NPDC097707 TaxID=3364007 RepID=UPI00383ACC00
MESKKQGFGNIIIMLSHADKKEPKMKKIFAIAALLTVFSPLSQAQNYPPPRDEMRHSEPWQPGPGMRNDRELYKDHVMPAGHNKTEKHVRCHDGSRQKNAQACRHHGGLRTH